MPEVVPWAKRMRGSPAVSIGVALAAADAADGEGAG
jgi:hypothetical protein